MKLDGTPEGFRQANAWLHTWSGLVLGWLLFAVFLTGTLSYFLDEINTWMRPELHRSHADAATVQRAVDRLATLAPEAGTWTLNLPDERQPAVEASWRNPGAAAGRAGTSRAWLDAGTGEPVDVRETRAGGFFYRFHFELHYMPRVWGRWIVGIATMVMLVAIVSGVITHRKIFADFFTFRPAKSQRSWLDAHNVSAVLSLPFHLMITLTGVFLLMFMLMPAGRDLAFADDPQAFQADRRGGGGGSGGNAAGGRERRGGPPEAAPLTALGPLMATAAQRWPERGVGAVVVQQPGTARATIELRENGGASLAARGAGERLLFDGVTGTLKSATPPARPTATIATYNVLTALHLGRFAGPGVRWLLFLSGLLGTAMVATGLVLWVVKRLPERRKLGGTPFGHRLVEVLNTGSVSGLLVAVAAYFWLNRLLPADWADRAAWEVNGFFAVWALAALHPLLRQHRQAWVEQLGLAAVLFGLLPLLNPLTGGSPLWTSLVEGHGAMAGVDLAALVAGLALGTMAWKLHHSPFGAAAPRRARTAAVAPSDTALEATP